MTAVLPIRPVTGPVTAARLERCLDRLALVMSEWDDGGAVFLPLYRRIERDIAEQQAVEQALAEARARARSIKGTATLMVRARDHARTG